MQEISSTMAAPIRPSRATPQATPALPRVFAALLLLGAATGLTGCVGAAVGAGATVGVAAMDDRGVQGVARDAGLATRVRGKWLNYDLETGDTLAVDGSVKVYNRRAMLTGTVKTEDIRAKAVRLTWEVEGIEEVINELAVGDTSLSDSAIDSWISAQLTAKLTFDKDVQAINYIIETENAVVYLLGAAQSRAELDRVLGHARGISRVRDVISHVRIKAPEAPAADQPKKAS
ncbi:MAG TPA: phospholipid-binding domain-containing protein [Rhodospirillaceae bacterium]|nr:phospholipid-binding domain-containing protein [Rhodospirillaceae bacterium]HCS70678.1 phospholipid-binding domain-containing protein [Rhodospirillaceae bacterium]